MLGEAVSTVAAAMGHAPETVRRWQRAARECDREVEGELRRTREAGAMLVALGSPDYPPLLAAIPDPPPLLWIERRDGVTAERAPMVAIVGTRRPTAYGLETAARFGEGLASHGLAIASGGARGIDAAAHRAALRVGGATIAVLGSGLGRRYPPEHDRLFDEIVAGGGAVLSEWPIATEPRPGHFPRRNRIVSGLSIGVVVVEAARRSGALITARLAVEEHGREAMAVPGRIDMPQSAGCLKAIREGWAAPVASLAEIGEQLAGAVGLIAGAGEIAARSFAPGELAHAAMGGEGEGKGKGEGKNKNKGKDDGKGGIDATIVEIVARHRGDRGAAVDAIVAETGLAAEVAAARVVRLRLAGRIVE